MSFILVFLLWTLILYTLHRFIHSNPILCKYHIVHHAFINKAIKNTTLNKWHWSNLFLYNDNYESTIDLWTTEVLPTILFSYVTGCWYITIFYYIWAAFIQEPIEHNQNFNIPFILSGTRHLIHHKFPNKNYGLFFPLWDMVFKTYKNH